ncbi:hypothetical protein CcaverHIS002_0109270 [Cutaneotrichosporon cavernicola]|uniref:Peptidase M20 dimerisation domain-containing protein n=1 Tax=Cutaneotrichosporon cavernicola TaxID=279322 RepID=A0AA48IC90_9TREE|nr:uncharacterized protein CcaverHIS019_0109190 [Cutaneotrichosporon cavernicola]BEI80398.1 hypothetical protein CcaverHIS002_0109270 [Cutaneotrichosporon cavernicola]BEI88201.1 hypothetical protein CcaverHIS019_0109190 [Cutaneotrichosporon cavernicola]BEI95972.1 hypothetical protein CcaverHIS631_0109210 [Cutaneotrichosporon cavernicola]BEJ03746.1 hypothetical protein CcaverHIS641_0109210 [Cutaneotrichosporon cavernicola]
MTKTVYQPGDLRVDAKRINATLHETCEIGAAHRWGPGEIETGMCRLALSDEDKEVRDWFTAELKRLGCNVVVDAMGNMFGIRPGKKEGAPTAMGSHLDTQPTGGRYDGILGVMAAIEVLRVLKDNNIETEYPVAAVTWTNEEGARFPTSMFGSGVWADVLPLEQSYALADIHNPKATVKSELERIGYLGDAPCSYKDTELGAHFELHIEQGPILEREEKKVGVVIGGQGYRWFDVVVQGRDSHAGTTPLQMRSDAMLVAARIIAAANDVAVKHDGLATTGIISLEPGSINTVAKTVNFSMDIRHMNDDKLEEMDKDLRARADEICRGAARGCTVEWNKLSAFPVTKFHESCVDAIRAAAEFSVGKDLVRDIYSGAGHDSCQTALHCPTGMIFVPCKDGLSHNPEEWCTAEDCALGTQVLLDAVMAYDAQRQS